MLGRVHSDSQLPFWTVKEIQTQGKLIGFASLKYQKIGNWIQVTLDYVARSGGTLAVRATDLRILWSANLAYEEFPSSAVCDRDNRILSEPDSRKRRKGMLVLS